jgi:hypothetical protein
VEITSLRPVSHVLAPKLEEADDADGTTMVVAAWNDKLSSRIAHAHRTLECLLCNVRKSFRHNRETLEHSVCDRRDQRTTGSFNPIRLFPHTIYWNTTMRVHTIPHSNLYVYMFPLPLKSVSSRSLLLKTRILAMT